MGHDLWARYLAMDLWVMDLDQYLERMIITTTVIRTHGPIKKIGDLYFAKNCCSTKNEEEPYEQRINVVE